MGSRKDDLALPGGKSSDVKPKIFELDRKIGHKIFTSISKFSMDRDEIAHIVDPAIHGMELIGYTIAEGGNETNKFFVEYLLVDRAAAL